MPSKHHGRRSPSPSSSSGSYESRRRRSHRSHKSRHDEPRHEPRHDPRHDPRHQPSHEPRYDDRPPSYHSSRPKLEGRRPDLNRSLSEDTYRDLTRRHRSRDRDSSDDESDHRSRDRSRGRDHSRRRDRRSHYDDDNYHYDKRGRPLAHAKGAARAVKDARDPSSSRSSDRAGVSGSMKPIVEDVMAAFGLVAKKHAKKTVGRGSSRRRPSRDREQPQPRHQDHRDYRETDNDPIRSPNTQTAALRAAITAAALEAFRTRKEFGTSITPQRLLRIAGAAITAGGLDAIVRRDRGEDSGGTRQLIESVIGGMKSSSAFGHRIRRRHGMTTSDQAKQRLMRAATVKVLDKPFGDKVPSLAPPDRRSTSSTALSSLMRGLTVNDKDRR